MKFLAELRAIRATQGVSPKDLAARMAAIDLPPALALASKYLPQAVVVAMWCVPAGLTAACVALLDPATATQKAFACGASPMLFFAFFVLTGGLISRLGQPGVVEGKFPRRAGHPIYALRRIFGAAWTQVYYFKPLYAVCLAIPPLKWLLFRLYGYRGNLDFTVYPDSWIRDLPLLRVGEGVYLANRCTVGTNLCLNDDSILVGKCTFDDHSLVGHLGVFGLGSRIGKHGELGVAAATGIRVIMGDNVRIAPCATINHGARLGDNVRIGTAANVGMKSRIAANIEVAAGANIPARADIKSQEEADQCFAREGRDLNARREALTAILDDYMQNRGAEQPVRH